MRTRFLSSLAQRLQTQRRPLFPYTTLFRSGGTHHINEQWPSYWIAFFQENGFQALDCIRPSIWNNEKVAWWYAQNMFAFIKDRKSTRLNSSHTVISYAVFCLKKKQTAVQSH